LRVSPTSQQPPWDLAPRLVGEIVVLEPLAAGHFEGLFAAARPSEIWTWWPFNAGVNEAAFAGWFEEATRARAAGTASHFATLDARSGRPIGSTSFCTPRPDHRGLEIGWTWMTPAAWGTGANAEAKLLQLGYAFETLGCIRVDFDTDEQNERSRRALEAIPAQFEGVLRNFSIADDGTPRSSAYYSILEAEWPRAKENLGARVRAARSRSA
jgi:RimJ/RimL family protein N-acetyltransferase